MNDGVTCAKHGPQDVAFACSHLCRAIDSGQYVGFFCGTDTHGPCPEAWCVACELCNRANPNADLSDWMAIANFQFLCIRCWDEARALSDERQRRHQVSTGAVVSVLLCVLSWQLTAALVITRWVAGPGGIGPVRQWIALSISIALTVQNAVYGWRHFHDYQMHVIATGKQPALSWGQAGIVVLMTVMAGALGTWLFAP